MMTLIKNCLLCAVVLVAMQFGAVQAETRLGFDFDTSTYPAWDLSGGYNLNQPITGAGGVTVPLSYTVYITHDAKGRLSGSGSTLVNVDGQVVAASYTLKGTVSGGGNNTRANFSVSFKGKDWFYGVFRSFNLHANYKLNVNPVDLTLSGKANGNISIEGSGSSQIKADETDLPLPTGVTGSWSVNVAVTLLKSFYGTGTVGVSMFKSPELPGGWPDKRILLTEVKGSYSSSKNLVNTSLKGIDDSKGSDLNAKFYLDGVTPPRVNGKILGQKIKW